jgi:hypothetical protein
VHKRKKEWWVLVEASWKTLGSRPDTHFSELDSEGSVISPKLLNTCELRVHSFPFNSAYFQWPSKKATCTITHTELIPRLKELVKRHKQ